MADKIAIKARTMMTALTVLRSLLLVAMAGHQPLTIMSPPNRSTVTTQTYVMKFRSKCYDGAVLHRQARSQKLLPVTIYFWK